jgi:hypothetical protein
VVALVLNLITIESNQDCQVLSFSGFQRSVAKAGTEVHFAIHRVGCKAQQRSQAVESHSEIVQVARSDQLTHRETGQHSATQAVAPLDRRAAVAIEPHFETVRVARRDQQAPIGDSSPIESRMILDRLSRFPEIESIGQY